MTKIIVDSNIVFSALRSKNSQTLERMLTSDEQYFAPNFLIGEIFIHKERIMKNSKTSAEETYAYFLEVIPKINFFSETRISIPNFIYAHRLCKNVDEDDTPFVALSLELGYPLWTRDKQLKIELQQRGFTNFFEENDGA